MLAAPIQNAPIQDAPSIYDSNGADDFGDDYYESPHLMDAESLPSEPVPEMQVPLTAPRQSSREYFGEPYVEPEYESPQQYVPPQYEPPQAYPPAGPQPSVELPVIEQPVVEQYGQAVPEPDFYQPGCGMESFVASPMPAMACDCGPVCGCEWGPAPELNSCDAVYSDASGCDTSGCDASACGCEACVGGLMNESSLGGCSFNLGQKLHQIIGDTSQCDPCAGNTYRPGLLPSVNDFCVRNGLAVDSFLIQGCGYFSIDLGIAMTGDRVNHVGAIAGAIDGSPTYDLQEGGFARYAIGMGSGNMRVETELGFHRTSIDETKSGAGPRSGDSLKVDGYRRSTTLMVNGFYDLKNSTFWTPYLKGGVGISHNVARSSLLADINSPATINALGLAGPSRIEADYPRSGTTKFAWSIGAGLAVDLTQRIKFDFEYQFLNAGDAQTGVNAYGDALDFDNGAMHELAFGLRFYR
ncbi:MAG: outer membrane beta-barrel protein [Pirellulaceae bacterium]